MSVKELHMSDNEDGEMVATEIKPTSDKNSVRSDGRETWVNERRNPISLPIVCRVPQKIVILMRSVEKIMSRSGMSQLEFGAFLHGDFNESGTLIVGEDFYIPAQDVSGAAIDFNEQPPEAKFNGVIHRHPTGCKSFSGTDGAHINKNFEFSLLYEGNDIIKGIFNLEVNGVRIQLPLDIQVMYPIFGLDDTQIMEKIHRQRSSNSSTTSDKDDDDQMGFAGPYFSDRKDIKGFLESHTDEDEEDDKDAPEEKMCTCKRCGQLQFIDSFPTDCESCDMKLNEEDVDMINDLEETVRPPIELEDGEELDG